MKVFCIFSILLIAAAWAAPPQAPENLISVPQKCDDVLSVKVCDKIKSMAASVKLGAETATQAFKDAYQKGKRTTEEIYKSVEEFYLEKIKAKKCEDFVSAETCTKLRVAGENLKIKAGEVEVFVKKALLEGKNKAIEVYQNVIEYYNNEVKGKSCEELLSKTPQVCTTLRKAATAVKVKTEQVTRIVREALINGYNNATAVVKRGITQIKDYASKFTCEELLNPNLCVALREYSAKFKVAFPKIMATVRDLLVKGFNVATGFLKIVYKITDAFIDCEDVFTEDSCKLIKEKITSLGGTLTKIGTTVREFATKAISKTEDVYHKVLNYTKNKWCTYIKLGCSSDPADNKMVKRSTISGLFKKYKEMLSKGIALAKQKLKEAVSSLLESLKIVDQTVRKVITEAINDGKIRYNELKELLKKLINTATGKTTNATASDEVDKTKRDIRDTLKQALEKAHASLKAAIKFLISRSTEELRKMHTYISALLKSVFGSSVSKREIDDLEVLEIMAESLVESETEKIAVEAELIANELIDEAIVEAEEDTPVKEVGVVKRDITSGIKTIKDIFSKISGKVNDVLTKLRSLNLEEIKKALENAGLKLIGVAEEILKKIKERLGN